jgi:16S rRNA (cytosine1402-N4)-methyltransferase
MAIGAEGRTMNAAPHVPVLLDEVLAALAIASGETHVDGTYGAGGYSRAMADAGAKVIAFDRDPDAIAAGRSVGDDRIGLIEARFSDMASHIDQPVEGIVLDIGVSSMQLDQAGRGFSFQGNGPLDMRMEQAGESAADFLNTADEADIADVIYRYGDEPKSRRIAHAIVAARPLTTTGELARAVRKATGWRDGDKKDPATRSFQAIRIHINRELEELADGLVAAEALLGEGGRLAVVTFHSLEDRMVKRFLRDRSGSAPQGSRHAPAGPATRAATFTDVTKPVTAGEAELARNPRARSATLRSARRTAAPTWGHTGKDAA